MARLDRFRQQCRGLRLAVVCVLVGLVALLALIYGAMPLIYLADHGRIVFRSLLLLLIHASPAVAYLWALWAVQHALGDMAEGRMFQPTVARALRRIGYGVIAGALLNIFAVTNLSRMLVHGRGGFAYFDLSGMVLAVIGAALILLARLVEQAGRLQRELDEMI